MPLICCQTTNRITFKTGSIQFILGRNYSGVIFIEFGKKNYPRLEKLNDSILQIKVPSNGVVRTATMFEEFKFYSEKMNFSWGSHANNKDYEVSGIEIGKYKNSIDVDSIYYDSEGNKVFVRNLNDDYNFICFYISKNSKKTPIKEQIIKSSQQKCTCSDILEKL